MGLKKEIRTAFHVFIVIVLVTQLFGCGYLLYPERRGQKGGTIDPGVAVLDACGLLFFIIPGLIAFAVDFSSGAIYLPPGKKSSASPEDIKVVRVNPADLSEETIKEVVIRETGCSPSLDLSKAEVYVWDRPEGIQTELAQLSQSGYRKN